MGNKRSIDILLATYNGQAYLREQIDSILAQSNQDWQLLIRDDGSNDNTVSIIKDYVAKYSDKILLIEDSENHLGASLNFSRLLENSTAEYIMFSDQDDVWLPRKVEATLNLMKATEKAYPNKPILVHTDLRVVDSRLKIIAKSLWKYQGIPPEIGNNANRVVLQNCATGCTIMINSKAKEISLPVPKEAIMHDWWLAINAAKHGKIVYIPKQLVLYRQHSNNAVGAKKFPKRKVWGFLKNIIFLKKRVLNHYEMVKKYDPNAKFWLVVSKKVANKIARQFGQEKHECRDYYEDVQVKIEKDIERILPYPATVQIETTTRCFANCMMCPHRFVARPEFMPLELIEKILNECAGKDVTIIPHQMGDILADPRALDILKMCKDRSLKILMSTSGILLDKEKAHAMVSIGVDVINISLDSLDKKLYEKIRKVSFDKVMRNIQNLLAVERPSTKVWVSAIDMFFNENNRNYFIDYWKGLADNVQITPYVQYPKVRVWQLPSKEVKNSTRCPRLETDMVILSNGEVAKCCIDFEGTTTFGNAAQENLAQIWNSRQRSDFIEAMRIRKRKMLYPCNICLIPVDCSTEPKEVPASQLLQK